MINKIVKWISLLVLKFKRPKSLLTRLIWSVGIPEFLIFLTIGILSYQEMENVLIEKSQEQSEALNAEISNLQSFMDFSTSLEDRKLDGRVALLSWKLRDLYFYSSDSIEFTNLKNIQLSFEMDTTLENINIANRNGIIVNSTNLDNIGSRFDETGENINEIIGSVLSSDKLISDQFTYERSTSRLRKFSYQSTRDRNYIIRLDVYSNEGTAFSNALRNIISKINNERKEVRSLEIFLGSSTPFSFTSDLELDEKEKAFIKKIFTEKKDSTINKIVDEKHIQTEYIYNERNGAGIFRGTVVRLEKDNSLKEKILRENLMSKSKIFAFGILVLFIILLINAKFITKPLKLISGTVKLVGSGRLNEKVPITGNIELRELAASFNQMTTDLADSNLKIRRQKEKIEEAHHEIKSSISYARHIQQAILPPINLFKEYLKESFILYKPKDIVAGDFYWFEVKDDYIFYAAADCTGHGVPGAMLSVVCSNSLNRSVNEFRITDPGKILDRTTQLVIETFKKSEYEIQDGMDISLVRLDLKNEEAVFSGAHNALYLVSANNQRAIKDKTVSNETHFLSEYKGDKQPVGKYSHQLPFNSTHISLNKGDCLYVFTDGFADQFGGEKEKKFMYKPFKELLMSLANEPMEKQKKQIDKTFEDWKRHYEQIDDVCVIGVRI